MTSYPDSNAGNNQKPQKGWFGRNWLWFLPLIILGPFLCCCGTCSGCVYMGLSQIDNLPPYKDTVVAAQNDPTLQAELGTPIEAAGMFEALSSGGSFDVAQTTTGGSLLVEMPISGPSGSGVLHIEATSDASGVWTYTRREVVIDGSGTVIDLMPADAAPDGILEDVPDVPELPEPARP